MLERKIGKLEMFDPQKPKSASCKLRNMRALFICAFHRSCALHPLDVVPSLRPYQVRHLYFLAASAFFASAARLISTAHRHRLTHGASPRRAAHWRKRQHGVVQRVKGRTCNLLGAHNGSGVLPALCLLGAGHLEELASPTKHQATSPRSGCGRSQSREIGKWDIRRSCPSVHLVSHRSGRKVSRQTRLASLLLQVLLSSLVTLVATSHLVGFFFLSPGVAKSGGWRLACRL